MNPATVDMQLTRLAQEYQKHGISLAMNAIYGARNYVARTGTLSDDLELRLQLMAGNLVLTTISVNFDSGSLEYEYASDEERSAFESAHRQALENMHPYITGDRARALHAQLLRKHTELLPVKVRVQLLQKSQDDAPLFKSSTAQEEY